METNNLQKNICIWLTAVMLICGICTEMGRTNLGSVCLDSTIGTETAVCMENFEWTEQGTAVYSRGNDYSIEVMSGRELHFRNRGGNTGLHEIESAVFEMLVQSKDRYSRMIAECIIVFLWCTAIVIQYIHLTDGEKGCCKKASFFINVGGRQCREKD